MGVFDFREITDIRGWFTESPAESDVILSSRARLARNLFSYAFPAAMSAEDEESARDEIVAAFRDLPVSDLPWGDGFSIIYLDELEPADRRVLLERSIVSQDYSLAAGKAVILQDDGRVSVVLNDGDHLRLAAVMSGLRLREVHRRVDDLDTALEQRLHFAASLEWGYLTASIQDAGTGLRASVMLHLPALAMTSLLEKALKTAAGIGLRVKGFFGEGSGSLGDMYQVSNELTMGMSESEILAILEEFVGKIAGFERKAREELLARRRADVEDRVFRAYGALRHCRFLSSKEAIELLARVRFGIATGILQGVTLERVTPLLFVCQKSHIQKVLDTMESDVDTRHIDFTRARIIRDALACA